ncbi:MAG: hypothetical protein M3P26_04510 [Gemmatimonadota bacterium]|nr:hypothetical protein [Gemmatimonadota bacterium]
MRLFRRARPFEASGALSTTRSTKPPQSRQIATILRIRRAERDRELALINIALKSGTTRLLG